MPSRVEASARPRGSEVERARSLIENGGSGVVRVATRDGSTDARASRGGRLDPHGENEHNRPRVTAADRTVLRSVPRRRERQGQRAHAIRWIFGNRFRPPDSGWTGTRSAEFGRTRSSTVIDSRRLTRWYDFQAPFYRLWRNRYEGPLASLVVRLVAGLPRHDWLLDAGCGTGLFAIALARALPETRIDGIDASAGMLSVARREALRYGLDNIRLAQGDVTALPYADDGFDVIVAAGLLPNLNDVAAALREFRRTLRPGGRLLIAEFDRSSMTLAVRMFFVVMILGYRAVSFFFRRFRFSDAWDVRASTVDRARLERQLERAGMRTESVTVCHGHLIFELEKGPER